MKLVLCNKERSKKVSSEIRQMLLNDDYCIVDELKNVEVSDSVIIDWPSREQIRPCYNIIRDAKSILFMFEGFTIDTRNSEYIQQMQSKALQSEDWDRCKAINEVKVEINLLMQNEVLDSFPSELQLESTDFCNAKCIMCSHFYENGKSFITEKSEMLDSIEPIYPYLRTVYLHGNGEPFSMKSMGEYLGYLAKYNIHFTTNTNLSIVTDEVIAVLKDHFFELNISCDSGNKKTYEYIRRGLNFERFVKNCRKVRRECSDLYMRMWSIVMRQNVYSLTETLELAAKLGFDEVVFTQLSTSNMLGNINDTMVLYPQILQRQLELAKEYGEKMKIKVTVPDIYIKHSSAEYITQKNIFDSFPLYRSDDEYDELYRKIKSMGNRLTEKKNSSNMPHIREIDCNFSGICDWCIKRPFISLNGDVSVCCINRDYKIGNIYETTFEKIWNSERARSFRRVFYNGKLPSICSGCEFMMQDRLEFLKIREWKDDLRRKQV